MLVSNKKGRRWLSRENANEVLVKTFDLHVELVSSYSRKEGTNAHWNVDEIREANNTDTYNLESRGLYWVIQCLIINVN